MIPESNDRIQECPRARRPGWRFLVKALLFLVVCLILLGLAAACAGFLVYQHVTQPGVSGEQVRITVPDGVTGRDVGRILAENGLVEHEAFFRLALRLDNVRKPIKQGWYALPRGLSALELLHMIQKGPNRAPESWEIPAELKVTVPEGLTIAQAAQLFANPDAFVQAASAPGLIARLGIRAPTLEGFLMPNTYYFDKKPSEREVVERMLAEFEKEYGGLTAQIAPPPNYDKLAVVTIASLIEEEARVPDERPTVAAVIYNRLRKGMPLQLDSTLQYALNKYGLRLLHTDREADSSYNTYKHAGLPPGPISNPGLASLKAALQPADADYLYFVSNADGRTHTFSSTEAEHLRAVERFRKEIAPQREALERE
jgi:UPF0755 protein